MSLQLGYLLKGIVDILGLVLLASATLFFNKVKKYLQDRQSRKFDLSINKSAKTQGLISELRAITDADNVKVYQIHNGDYFLHGGSAMKSSMTHYYVKTGVAIPALHENQNIPTTHFSNLFKCMRDHDYCALPGPEEIDPVVRRMMSTGGTRTALVMPLRRDTNIWVGFLAVSWMDSTQITPQMIQDTKRYAQEICDQLCCPPK